MTEQKEEIYIPNGCKTLADLAQGQIRLGLQGEPFSGKTTASLTFPNPAILSFDRKTSAHQHRSDVIDIPFYNPFFVDSIVKRAGVQCQPNRKDALLKWLSTEGLKLKSNQTLILDGSTGVEEAYHQWFSENSHLAVTKQGDKNDFIEWRMKNDFFGDLHTALKSLYCNVIYICHECPDRDKKGELNGKIRPLLTGQSGDKLAGNMTDHFRSIAIGKPTNDQQRLKIKEWGQIDDATLKEWIDSTPPTHQTVYLWQTTSDELCECGTSSLYLCPKYVVANYSSFSKYRKQNKQ